MILKILTIYDKVADIYYRPIFTENIQVTIRDLAYHINHETNEIQRNYKDLELYVIGEYDQKDGSLKTNKIEKIIDLKELKENENI